MIYMLHGLLIHLSVLGHLGCFKILTIVSNNAMTIGIQVPFCEIVFGFLREMPRNDISGS